MSGTSEVPHCWQNRTPLPFAVWQLEQLTVPTTLPGFFALATYGRRAVATISRCTTAMPPAMTIVLTWAVMIVIVMMPAMATASVVTTQQHVK